MKFIDDAIKESEERMEKVDSKKTISSDIDEDLIGFIKKTNIFVVGAGGAGNNTISRLSEIGIEGAERDLMQRKPENGDILTRKTLLEILISGIVMAIGTIAVFAYEFSINATEQKAMTVAFTLFVMYQLFNAYNRKADSDASSKYLYMAIVLSFVLQVLIIYIPQLQLIFRTTSLNLMEWVMIIIVAFTIVVADKLMTRVIK